PTHQGRQPTGALTGAAATAAHAASALEGTTSLRALIGRRNSACGSTQTCLIKVLLNRITYQFSCYMTLIDNRGGSPAAHYRYLPAAVGAELVIHDGDLRHRCTVDAVSLGWAWQ